MSGLEDKQMMVSMPVNVGGIVEFFTTNFSEDDIIEAIELIEEEAQSYYILEEVYKHFEKEMIKMKEVEEDL